MTVNLEEFNAEMQQQKQRARNAAAIETGDWITLKEGTTEFVGYEEGTIGVHSDEREVLGKMILI